MAVEVGRGVLQDSIVLAAQVSLRKMAKKDGIFDIFEAFWKRHESDGASFIQEVIEINARELYAFRQGNVRQAIISWKAKLQLLFLRDIGQIATAKEIEMAMLPLLCTAEINKEAHREYVDTALPILERIGLFFAVTSVNKKARCQRVLSIATSIKERKDLHEFDLNKVEEAEVLESLDVDSWGKTPTKRKVATAILRRLDAARAYEESESMVDIDNITLEHILPISPRHGSHWKLQWSSENQDIWTHKLGNLAILNGKKNSKAGNEDFTKKREIYKAVPFPITADLRKLDGFGAEECRLRHEAIINECQTGFGLDSHLLRD